MNPNGTPKHNYPYFITKEAVLVKKVRVPAGTKLTYEKHQFKKGQQSKMLSEDKLTAIELPEGETINWAGVPVNAIVKFFNAQMCGFTVYAYFDKLSEANKTGLSELWQSCDHRLGLSVKNINDWSYNTNNIVDAESCGVLFQRYFKDDADQQLMLDKLYSELMKLEENKQ